MAILKKGDSVKRICNGCENYAPLPIGTLTRSTLIPPPGNLTFSLGEFKFCFSLRITEKKTFANRLKWWLLTTLLPFRIISWIKEEN